MHPQAHEWVQAHATQEKVAVLDIGGRDINGTTRELFTNATSYIVLDIRPGENVDFVADASTWVPDREYDVVVCTEVFEHTDVWPGICHTAFKALASGGEFIATMAGPGRGAHSAIDGGPIHPGEHYENISMSQLHDVLDELGFVDIVVDGQLAPADTRCVARHP